MQELDPRIVRVGIQIGTQIKYYEGLNIEASGTKYANPNQDDCELKISNLDRTTRDYILTQTSPFNKTKLRKQLILEAGRKSYGTTLIFKGDIITSQISQPPDITLTMKAMTGNYLKGSIIGRRQPARASLKNISSKVAQDLGATLDYQADDKTIGNYSFSGAALKQVDKLGEAGGVNAFLDGDVLTVKNYNVPLKGKIRTLDLESGMIGIPEFTERGLKVTFLIDKVTRIGSGLQVTSKLNPAVNGIYTIYKLGFNIASRDKPFYYIAEATKYK